jgi:hypothetical protein
VAGRHLREHAEGMVERHCLIGEDRLAYVSGRGGPRRLRCLFVHPRTGLLCWQPRVSHREHRAWRARTTPAPTLIKLADDDYLWSDRGIWFQVRTEVVAWLYRPKRVDWHFEAEGRRLRVVSKRQLNHRQLREHGLANATEFASWTHPVRMVAGGSAMRAVIGASETHLASE